MLTPAIFLLLAALDTAGPEWASVANTFLLILLAALTWAKERAARRDRDKVNQNARTAVAAAASIDKKVTDVQQKITGEHRDPDARTREDDPPPWQPR